MSLDRRIEQLERHAGDGEEVVWDIFLVGVERARIARQVVGYRDSRGRGEWTMRDGESIDDLRKRASEKADRSTGPVVIFCEQYA